MKQSRIDLLLGNERFRIFLKVNRKFEILVCVIIERSELAHVGVP